MICLGKRLDLDTYVQEDYLDKRYVQDKSRTVPIFCHGDAAEYETRDSHDLELGWSVEFFANTPFPHALGLLPQGSNKPENMGFSAGVAQMEFPSTAILLPPRGWP